MELIENFLSEIVNRGNTILWDYLLIYLLLGAGLYFTIRSRFVQFRLFGEMFKVIKEEAVEQSGKKGTNAFQAFSITIASRVGTGNLAGVALAVAIGGPGAVFWMWVVALIGMATAFIESMLAQVYKEPDKDGFRGGPAYYMEKALGQKWLGILFSILITISFGFIFNAVQANTISSAVEEAFQIDPLWTGIALVILAGLIIFGGIKRIASVAGVIVPIMAVIYMLVAFYVVLTNLSAIPEVFGLIFGNAFGGMDTVFGGGAGAAMMYGIQRGLFSNEAGMGSAPNAAATAGVNHPVKQGLVQSLAVFFDTIVICSLTAFIVILYDNFYESSEDGIQLTQVALSQHVGDWASIFIAITIFFFAFSSVVGNYYYGETNISFLNHKGIWLTIYRIFVLGMVMFGSLASIQLVWDMADLFMAMMAIVNLIAILLLSNIAIKVLQDYTKQKKQGKDPAFHHKNVKGLKNLEWWGAQEEKK
ncbi:alanine or glycine:cation symporter, AGCS family [Gracilibacillus ureilyticus]|uniref:Alanine or glycine:cation symporter, AGCS family n=1 Tax=Gracilibacillus ureilyticus TaxID=531814 RepID=A0A1H9TCH4_9BACI|nr:alanine/glycine:cation symporter family protein [Gracilibacillus ureilyticus]SER94727.1 alanine or glycine:cation symporter, AGCS family [Gracilibacillus ureilyticus]